MLFNIAGYFFGFSLIMFGYWNLTIMREGIGMNWEERKEFMGDKKLIESKNRFLKPARVIGYISLLFGSIIYLTGYLV